MEFIRGINNLSDNSSTVAATIGNFDGVHLGHQAILQTLKSVADKAGMLSTIVIFEPQPIEYFAPDSAPSRLTRLREKLQEFRRHNIDRVVCIKFDSNLANLSANEFVKQILIDGLNVKALIIGDDFRFAKNREGNFQTLVNAGAEYGFEVQKMQTFYSSGERVSSTLIREALATGQIINANQMLGRPYRISGRIVHGEKRGRKIGFATANIELKRYQSPVHGIFSGRVFGISDEAMDAVIYVGSRPVYNGERVLLEVHILNFEQDIYGKQIQIEFIEKLRGDANFDTEEEMIKQIHVDIEHAKISLQKNNN
ncbi:MAG: bifunctional riboflavin kinase/FAD synthetase [Pseudomonadota bacterium]